MRGEEILDFIDGYATVWGWPPSIRDIVAGTGFSSGSVTHRLRILRDKGLVTWVPGKARTLRITKEAKKSIAFTRDDETEWRR